MKLFKLLYILCLLGTIVLGDIPVFSIIIVRYIAVAVLLILCLTQKTPFPKHTIYYCYYVFIFIFFITSFLKGYERDFIVVFLGTYLVSIVWIWATHILIKKYNSLDVLIKTVLIIGVVNAVVTVGQYYRNPIAFGVSYLLNAVDEDIVNSMTEQSMYENTFGGFAMYGLFGAVKNGYFSAVFCVICCWLLGRSKTILSKIASLCFWFFSVYSLFCVQERAALLGGVLFSVLYIIKVLGSNRTGKSFLLLISIVSIGILLSKGSDLFSFTEGTRYESFDLDTRLGIFATSKDYIFQNPFNANLFEYVNTYKKFPHHIVFYSFMCGTWIGGLIIMGALVYIMLLAARLLTRKMTKKNELLIMVSLALFSYIVPSFTHNDSIASGDSLFWIMAAVVLTTTTARNVQKEGLQLSSTFKAK